MRKSVLATVLAVASTALVVAGAAVARGAAVGNWGGTAVFSVFSNRVQVISSQATMNISVWANGNFEAYAEGGCMFNGSARVGGSEGLLNIAGRMSGCGVPELNMDMQGTMQLLGEQQASLNLGYQGMIQDQKYVQVQIQANLTR